jgi:type IV pilus assembly protein PilA
MGVVYLLFCWTLIPGLVSFVEFIVFLVSDQQRWDDRYNEGIPSDSSGGSGAVVAIVVAAAALFGIFVIGILAAIAIPAYQDYTIRAQATEAFAVADGLRQAVADARQDNGSLENVNEVAAELARESQYLDYVRVAPSGAVTIAFNAAAAAPIRGQTLIFEPQSSQGDVPWDCTGGTLAAKYRPSRCRR